MFCVMRDTHTHTCKHADTHIHAGMLTHVDSSCLACTFHQMHCSDRHPLLNTLALVKCVFVCCYGCAWILGNCGQGVSNNSLP